MTGLTADAEESQGGSSTCLDDDSVRLTLPGGHVVVASKTALAQRCAFFQPLADEAGPAEWGEKELEHILTALSPGAQAALPQLLEVVGAKRPQAWDNLFETECITVFAAAHILGATECLDAAREWAAGDRFRLAAALGKLNAKADASSLRKAAAYGLDQRSETKLLHAAAEADAAEALQVIVSDEDALGDTAASAHILAPIDLRDAAGRTALQICAVHDCAGAAAVLIEYSATLDAVCDPPEDDGANEDLDNSMGITSRVAKVGIRTALHLAAMHDSANMVSLLLERKAYVACCVKNSDSAVTPLHECAASDSVGAARLLAAAAFAAAESPEPWLTAVEGAADQPKPPEPQDVVTAPADEGEVQWCRFLDPLHAKVGLQGSTPLHTAAENDAPGVTAVLLDAKADPSIGDDQGDTPLHCAALYACPLALGKLVQHGAPLLAENSSGELPLHMMANFGEGDGELSATMAKRHFARSFRAQEALVEALRRTGELDKALKHAALGDNGNMPLHSVAHWDHLGAQNAIRLLLAARAEAGQKNGDGNTPLDIARRRYKDTGKVAKILEEHLGTAAAAAAPPAKDVDMATTSEGQRTSVGGAAAEKALDPVPAAASSASIVRDPLAEALGGSVRSLVPGASLPEADSAGSSNGGSTTAAAAATVPQAAPEAQRSPECNDVDRPPELPIKTDTQVSQAVSEPTQSQP